MDPSVRLGILIVADDFTGAMDSAVPFATRGLTVSVLPSPGQPPGKVLQTDVVSIATNTRHLSPEEAFTTVERVARRCRSFQPEITIKKVDSTLRGNIAEECRAMSGALEKESLLVCPAVPDQQRAVINGDVHVDGVPLRETPFPSDIRSPAPAVPLAQLFQKQFGGWDIVSGKDAGAAPEIGVHRPRRLIICDARTNEDIYAVVKSRRSYLQRDLLIGASGLTEAVARELFGSSRSENRSSMPATGNIMFVIGSAARETARQLDTLVESRPVSIHELTDAEPLHVNPAASPPDESSTVFVIKAPNTEQSGQLDSGAVLSALARSAARFISSFNISHLVMTGGDTCESTLAQLGVEAVSVHGEIKQGTVYGRAETSGGTINLVAKAGGFGQPELFLDILRFFNF